MKTKEALQELIDGNQRFAEGKATRPNQTPDRRQALAGGQKPFACIVGCSDSRVSPEILFDQGLGDLFVLRVAGNVVNDNILGSLEYAVEHLGASLIVVLGHSACGAVSATVEGGQITGNIGSLVRAILPAAQKVDENAPDRVEAVARENVRRMLEKIKTDSPVLDDLVQIGMLELAGGFYDLNTGRVDWLP